MGCEKLKKNHVSRELTVRQGSPPLTVKVVPSVTVLTQINLFQARSAKSRHGPQCHSLKLNATQFSHSDSFPQPTPQPHDKQFHNKTINTEFDTSLNKIQCD